MASRNANGEGSIYQRKNGRWVGSTYVQTTSGTPKRVYVYGVTRAEAHEKLIELKAKNAQGILTADKNWKLAEYLDYWLEEVVKPNRRPATHAQCEQMVRLYLKPGLGRNGLQTLSVPIVQSYLNELLANGHSVSKVHIIRKVLSAALTRAMRDELLTRNVARLVELRGIETREVQPWSGDEVTRFLAVAQPHMWYPAFLLVLLYGLRRGEVLGLRWKDVDLTRGELHIRQQLNRIRRELMIGPVKTQAGRRDLPLLNVIVETLRQHYERLGRTVSDDDLVFTTSVGTPIEPRNFVRAFQIICKNHELRIITIHQLRHSQATLLMELGVPERVTQLILGHTRTSMTRHYQHGSMDVKREAIQALAATLEQTKTAQVEGPEQLVEVIDSNGCCPNGCQRPKFVTWISSFLSGATIGGRTRDLILTMKNEDTLEMRTTEVDAWFKVRRRHMLLGWVAVRLLSKSGSRAMCNLQRRI